MSLSVCLYLCLCLLVYESVCLYLCLLYDSVCLYLCIFSNSMSIVCVLVSVYKCLCISVGL